MDKQRDRQIHEEEVVGVTQEAEQMSRRQRVIFLSHGEFRDRTREEEKNISRRQKLKLEIGRDGSGEKQKKDGIIGIGDS